MVQGQVFQRFLQRLVRLVYDVVDQSNFVRTFASRYVYRDLFRVDYFATAVFFLAGFIISLSMVFSWQVANGYLPWWLVIVYYFLWVGFGGRAMGAAYTFAHREGHAGNGRLYRPWMQRHIGNLFENRIGLFYGNGRLVPCICSTTIIDGADDTFGEDDHMAHHNFGRISHDALPAHQRSQQALWAKHRASVFRNLSVVELGTYVMLGRFRTLAERHYLDFAGEASVDEIATLLKTRAKCTEMEYADYEFGYLPSLETTVEDLVHNGTCKNTNQAYVYQAKRKMPRRMAHNGAHRR